MKKYFLVIFLIAYSLIAFSQTSSNVMGIWENGGRFVEFYEKDGQVQMRVALKPYYATVYDAPISFSNPFETVTEDATYSLSIKYPSSRKVVSLPIFVHTSYLFTSFYKKIDFELLDGSTDNIEARDEYPLFGFWVEQGSKDGILLYPNDVADNFDAYFFEDNKYIRFRYWHDENLAYSEGKAIFKGSNGLYYKVPKMIKRGKLVYSCITTNGSSLRNYETGSYTIETDKFSQERGVFLVLNKEGASPGKNAVADTYPDYKYANKESIPLYLMKGGSVFAMGGPFLFRSSIQDLDAEIKKHNALRNGKKYQNIRDEDIIITP